MNIAELMRKRAAAYDAAKVLGEKPTLTAEETTNYNRHKQEFQDLDGQIQRAKELQSMSAAGAAAVGDQDAPLHVQIVDDDPYTNEEAAKRRGLGTNKGLRAIASAKLFFAAGEDMERAIKLASASYGERHSVTQTLQRAVKRETTMGMARALVASVGASGGFIVPPDYVNEIIELLRPKAVVRSSGPRMLPMPRGTLTLPGQTAPATATYGSETAKIASSQQQVGQIQASYKKLTALTPVSNDLMRYADPAADAFVRDDLVKIMALREDLAFLLGDGTQDSPRGFLSFANAWVQANGGTPGVWLTTANSTMAVNAADPANTTGGNFITSTESYTLATVAAELGGAVNRLDTAQVPDDKRVWFMHPRSYNYLFNVQNSLGVYVYREELMTGRLLTYPVKRTTQIGANYYDGNGSQTTCSFVFLVEMDEAMLMDSMTLELAVSREGTYVDGGGNTVSAFQSDQTLIRAIAEHDFHMRHDQSVAVIQRVLWAPAIS